jgi:uncharacterized membrane protein YeaQ/YmgE (transglycosylase-associated protein family)
VIWIIVGAIAGFVASKVLTGEGMGLLFDVIVGILGAFLGGWLAGLVGIHVDTGTAELPLARPSHHAALGYSAGELACLS